MVQEEVCQGPGFASTGISDIVQLARRGQEPENSDDVFAIEEHGDLTNRPVMQWLSPSKLQITVPNKSLIGVQKSSYEGIEIVIKFNPDDPAERKRWLKSLGWCPSKSC